MRAHILHNNIVENTISVASIPVGALDADLVGGSIGWIWDGEKLSPPQPNLEELKAQLTARATELRWEHETGGIMVEGIHIATGTADQNRITTVIANATLAGMTVVDFKAESGWVTLTVDAIRAIAATIARHVQACFSAERAHHAAIEALGTAEEASAYDVTTGWPPSGPV